ncbi:MAG: hypothetical protein M1839_003991 [Geoglossum umbratile]|nr:MAG: hypothetical protein M1839_003991 [Geoglossum umbratile]
MKTSLPEGVHTYAGRLASFSITYPLPSKSRTSSTNSKSQNVLAWSHQRPSPEQLAQAGFYYRPSPENLDSVECFLCRKGLDGWEECDDPIEEHLKHSADCGWAINTHIEHNPEARKRGDALSAGMMAARRATFADRWPHEGKKGWLCKVTKMVEAGWYYSPTPDSDDLVSCAYCSLSLDGWEPKDIPMEEHQRRSAECRFFTATDLPKAKTAGRKKGRTSKVSRASTQSANWTTFSANSSFADVFVEEGDSIMSAATRLAAKGKKYGAGKVKNVRGKKDEPVELSSFIEPEDDSFDVKVSEKPAKTTRGKKRTSVEMDADDHKGGRQGSVDTITQAPPAKRRTTRNSLAQVQNPLVTAPAGEDVIMPDADDAAPATTKKGARGRKSRTSTAKPRGRKISVASTASKASMRMEIDIPDDDEIDRALEADLDRPLTDDEVNEIEPEEVPRKRRLTRSRAPSSKVVASAAPVRKTSKASKMVSKDVEMGEAVNDMASGIQPEPELKPEPEVPGPLPKAKAPKGKQTRKVSAKQKSGPRGKANAAEETLTQLQASLPEEAQPQEGPDKRSLLDSSVVFGSVASPPPITRPKRTTNKSSRQIEKRGTRASATSIADSHTLPSLEADRPSLSRENDSGDESVDSMVSQATVRRGGTKRQSTTGKKERGGKKGMIGSRHIEDIVQRHVETAEPKMDEEERRPKRGKRGATTVITQKAEDSQIDTDMADASTETATQAARSLPDVRAAKAAKGKGARKAMFVEKANPQVEQGGASVEPAPEIASSAQLPRPKVVKGKTSVATKAKSTLPPTETERTPSPPVVENRQEQQEARQQVTPDPSNPSDAENQPPSSRPSSTPFQSLIPLSANTPPTKPNNTTTTTTATATATGLQTSLPWTAVDLETIFLRSPTSSPRQGGDADKENQHLEGAMKSLTSPEKKLTVGEWIGHVAKREEERLRDECERVVGVFEREGNRAMRVLEGIEVLE